MPNRPLFLCWRVFYILKLQAVFLLDLTGGDYPPMGVVIQAREEGIRRSFG